MGLNLPGCKSSKRALVCHVKFEDAAKYQKAYSRFKTTKTYSAKFNIWGNWSFRQYWMHIC